MRVLSNFCRVLALQLFVLLDVHSQTVTSALSSCHGKASELGITSDAIPYVPVRLGQAKGYFVIDTADTAAAVDPTAFAVNVRPQNSGANPNYPGQFFFDNFEWVDGVERVSLREQSFKGIAVRGTSFSTQAGLIGESFLPVMISTLDYSKGQNGVFWYGKKETFCKDAQLITEGFKAVSTAGYFSNDQSTLKAGFLMNVPAVPIRIGTAQAIAQLDSAFSDAFLPFTVEINQAFYDALVAAHVPLLPQAPYTGPLNCEGKEQPEVHYVLGSGYAVSILATDGTPAIMRAGVDILLKKVVEGSTCAGITTIATPFAQLGASWFKQAGRIILDPYSSRIWLQQTR